jgi:hypothetical protein
LQDVIRSFVQEEHVYLLEGGLDLWLAVLENTVECTPLLFNLTPAAIGLLEFGSETLKKTLRIIESYILLVPEMIVQVIFLSSFIANSIYLLYI